MIVQCYKVSKVYIKFDKQHSDSSESQRPSFPKELVENANFNKAVLNKIMTTHEQCEI